MTALLSRGAYRQQMLMEARRRAGRILSLDCFNSGSTATSWLVAGTQAGELLLWSFADCFSPDDGQVMSLEPSCRLQTQAGAIYALLSQDSGTGGRILLCATDSGLRGYTWAALMETAAASTPPGVDVVQAPEPLLQVTLPQEKGARGAMEPIAECNSVVVDRTSGVIWLAGGDNAAHGCVAPPIARDLPARQSAEPPTTM